MQKTKALMLKTKDNRNFLTKENNLKCLIEYAKTFKAQIFLVEVEEGKILELKRLAVALCSPEKRPEPKCSIINLIFPTAKNRKNIRQIAAKVKEHIRSNLLQGRSISLKELKKLYQHFGITDSCLCTHLTNTRKELISEGYKIVKIGAGNYCLQPK